MLVACLAVPAHRATGLVGGAGAMRADAAFNPGIPLLTPCATNVAVGIVGIATGVAFESNPRLYFGDIYFNGRGASACETVASGGGTIDAMVAGGTNTITGGTVNCANLVGTYIHVGTLGTFSVAGQCAINGVNVGRISLVGLFTMATTSAAPYTTAILAGTLTVSP
ncbi:MAG: hypothetical protein QOK43_1731 [Acidimicrobiaceae bacterium]|nr:hypothetical protein [Acidimicrobiaceae bacterium]